MPGKGRPERDVPAWSPTNTAEWYQAREATTALRDVLTAVGLHREFPFLRADMNAFGLGYVDLGRISPDTARRIAHLLHLGLAATSNGAEHATEDQP